MTRPTLLTLFTGLAALALVVAPAVAQTCSCTTYESAKQFVQFNDAIFKGKVLSSKTDYGIATTNFQVLETLKGQLGAEVAVTHPAPGPGKCGGVAFKPAQTVVIVAQGMMDDLGTTSCQINAYTEAQLRTALKQPQ
jgi:hypothetical protein